MGFCIRAEKRRDVGGSWGSPLKKTKEAMSALRVNTYRWRYRSGQLVGGKAGVFEALCKLLDKLFGFIEFFLQL